MAEVVLRGKAGEGYTILVDGVEVPSAVGLEILVDGRSTARVFVEFVGVELDVDVSGADVKRIGEAGDQGE